MDNVVAELTELVELLTASYEKGVNDGYLLGAEEAMKSTSRKLLGLLKAKGVLNVDDATLDSMLQIIDSTVI